MTLLVRMRVQCLPGKIAVGKRLLNPILNLLGGLFQFHGTQILNHGFRFSRAVFLLSWARIALSIFATSFTLERDVTENTLRQKRTVHRWYLASGNTTPTASSIPRRLPLHHQFRPVQTAATQPLKEIAPTGLVLFHTLDGTQNLAISVPVYCDRHQNGHIFILSAPVPTQIYLAPIDIWIPPTL